MYFNGDERDKAIDSSLKCYIACSLEIKSACNLVMNGSYNKHASVYMCGLRAMCVRNNILYHFLLAMIIFKERRYNKVSY